MSFDPTPWFIGGGAHHSPAVARLLAFAATGGAEGIVTPDSFKVSALAAPGGQVTIAPGAAVVLNRSAGGDRQSYVMRGATDTTVDVAPTGSAARSDLLVIRVEDPEFSPWQPPADPVTAQYTRPFLVTGVPGGTTDASALNLGYSAVAIARIDIPANTAAITSAMIKDVRKLARPRQNREVLTGVPTPADLTASAYTPFPDYRPTTTVPLWATHAIIIATVTSVGVSGGDTVGRWRLTFGNQVGPGQTFAYDGSGGYQRITETIVAELDVRGQRGATIPAIVTAYKSEGAGVLRSYGTSRVTFDVQYVERVV